MNSNSENVIGAASSRPLDATAAPDVVSSAAVRKPNMCVWVFAYAVCLAFEFFCRALDCIGVEIWPVMGGIAAVFVILIGYFKWQRSKAKVDAYRSKSGIAIISLGVTMLAAFFMLKFMMPVFLGSY
jgi:hypothetical protein